MLGLRRGECDPDPCNPDCFTYDECYCNPDPCNDICPDYDECECNPDPCNPDCPEYDPCTCGDGDPCECGWDEPCSFDCGGDPCDADGDCYDPCDTSCSNYDDLQLRSAGLRAAGQRRVRRPLGTDRWVQQRRYDAGHDRCPRRRLHPCQNFGNKTVYNDVWYKYTATCTGTLTALDPQPRRISTVGSLSTATCGEDGDSMIACNDDGDGCSELQFLSRT